MEIFRVERLGCKNNIISFQRRRSRVRHRCEPSSPFVCLQGQKLFFLYVGKVDLNGGLSIAEHVVNVVLFKQNFLPLKGSSLSTQVNKSLGAACQIFLEYVTVSNTSCNTGSFAFGQFKIPL